MRTKSRAQVAADRAKGHRPKGGTTPKVYAGQLIPAGLWKRDLSPFVMRPMNLQQHIASPGPKIGDDMRRKFALRGQRDLELSKAYTQADVEVIMSKYGPL